MKKIVGIIVLLFVLTGCSGNIKDGVTMLQEEKYEEAMKAFEKDIQKERNLDEAYRGFGIACFELGNYEEAANAFELALKNETQETATLFSFLGASYLETNEYEKSLDAYERALTCKDLSEELEQEVQYNLIAVYEGMANWDAARKQMDKYVKMYPDDTRVEKEAEFLETR